MKNPSVWTILTSNCIKWTLDIPPVYGYVFEIHKDAIYLFGGITDRLTQNHLIKFDLIENKWEEIHFTNEKNKDGDNAPTSVTSTKAVMLGNEMIFVGGCQKGFVEAETNGALYGSDWEFELNKMTCIRFDPSGCSWVDDPDYIASRSFVDFNILLYDESLLFIGGQSPLYALNSSQKILKYNLVAKSWSILYEFDQNEFKYLFESHTPACIYHDYLFAICTLTQAREPYLLKMDLRSMTFNLLKLPWNPYKLAKIVLWSDDLCQGQNIQILATTDSIWGCCMEDGIICDLKSKRGGKDEGSPLIFRIDPETLDFTYYTTNFAHLISKYRYVFLNYKDQLIIAGAEPRGNEEIGDLYRIDIPYFPKRNRMYQFTNKNTQTDIKFYF